MFCWRFAFQVDTPLAFGFSVLVSDSGGYATLEGMYSYNPPSWGSDVCLPLGMGIGFSRRNKDVSFAFALSGGASLYPVSISSSAREGWFLGFGGEVGAHLYLLSWGIEPVLSAQLLMPANLSLADASP